ncbi:hypothetical protein ACFV9E_08385 [Streptomyces sp. NPDC059835]|uniref:hypothetical protein n=1 Tax=Streptomyces sp. NPDC059835 TaxID=3346967 RepID=UPI003646DAF8
MIAEMIPKSFSHVVLVTGFRSWNDAKSVREALNDAWRGWGAKERHPAGASFGALSQGG